FYYVYRTAFKLIQDGHIGVPTGVSARFWFSPSRRPLPLRKQVIVQNGIHFLDLMQFLMGPACEVFAKERVIEDRATVTATIVFQSGAVGSVLLSTGGSWSYPNELLDVAG